MTALPIAPIQELSEPYRTMAKRAYPIMHGSHSKDVRTLQDEARLNDDVLKLIGTQRS